ncbi:MAG: helix-turn-helix domain-containing protein, partial [Shewanella sp.]
DCNTTQSEVGRRVGVDASEINRIVRGKMAPSSEYMLRILARLGYKITVEAKGEVILKVEKCNG